MWKNGYKGEEEFMEIKNVILEQELKNLILHGNKEIIKEVLENITKEIMDNIIELSK